MLGSIDCIDVPIEIYVSSTFERSNAIWLGKFIPPSLAMTVGARNLNLLSSIFHINNIRIRQCKIPSCTEWIEFIGTCYSLGCENCREDGWSAVEGRKLRFDIWMENIRFV
jgi:hypothetical protein